MSARSPQLAVSECNTMKILKTLAFGTALGASLVTSAQANETVGAVHGTFENTDEFTFTDEQMAHIDGVLEETYARVAEVFPEVADQVSVAVLAVNRPALDPLGGVAGRADRPDELVVEISQTYPDGIDGAIEDGMAPTFAHELHHTVRGWTMNGNHFGHGIQIAAVNEGLATVFAEELLGEVNQSDLPPADIEAWAEEVLALPIDANYGEWMFLHPDGRVAIGYRTGRWVVRRAMERSGLDITELTRLTPATIWQLAGFDWDRQLRRSASIASTAH
ncbi:DUF2268 domain-containing putative Zn-dependent protease [Aurantiacibacter sp. MUD11]|uniref:DUF2268 domain-containing putative Zn-dependent protease n=1 Tax=Aurantiacibacter sp. MUD11 TaxID=3003265 RepID=UPI0022AB07D1|nr:DUF2268 domain-containing putative Zn-dependent protease [Aurantiacibacter sp. MUD11]WAT17360.1 DUF2268 domain-containing putative Zn-dependent protease [Aurantiacibacter sp. MUD11]